MSIIGCGQKTIEDGELREGKYAYYAVDTNAARSYPEYRLKKTEPHLMSEYVFALSTFTEGNTLHHSIELFLKEYKKKYGDAIGYCEEKSNKLIGLRSPEHIIYSVTRFYLYWLLKSVDNPKAAGTSGGEFCIKTPNQMPNKQVLKYLVPQTTYYNNSGTSADDLKQWADKISFNRSKHVKKYMSYKRTIPVEDYERVNKYSDIKRSLKTGNKKDFFNEDYFDHSAMSSYGGFNDREKE